MSKRELQTRLVTELTNIGVPTDISTTADIVIHQEFTEEHNQGTILYQGKILLDSTSETLYFWEKIKAKNENLSDDPNAQESSLHHYKVKSLGTDKLGKHQEITLDLGIIPVFIKSFAKSQNWAYKHVSDESKASYTLTSNGLQNLSPKKASGCLLIILAITSILIILSNFF